MKHYLLSIYQPDGDPPASVDLDEIRRDGRRAERRAQGGRRVGVRRRAAPTEHRDRRARAATATCSRPTARTPRARSTSAASPSSRRPTSTPPSTGVASCRRATTLPVEVRPFQRALSRGRAGPCHFGDRACVPRGVRPRGRRPGPRLRRHRHRRGGGPGRVHHGRAAVAVRRAPAEPGGMDHHHRPQPRHRPSPPRGVPRRPARPGRAAARRRANPSRRAPCATTGSA